MKVIITGATGMVGKGVLLECLDHPEIKEAVSLSRKTLGMSHPKLKEIIHKDFSEFESIKTQLKGYDACYHCMGVSSAGMKEEDFKKLTYEISLNLARAFHDQNPNAVFTYVSGVGTDTTEKGSTMWARVKGKTENDLLKVGFKGAYMYRPGMIIPLRGIRSSTKLYQFFYDYLMWMVHLVKWISPSSVVNTTQMGFSMIHVTMHGYEKAHLEPIDILKSSM